MTIYYAPPEVYYEEGYDLKYDVWSLGCVLYEMLVGYTPFFGRNVQDVGSRVVRKKFIKPLPHYVSPPVRELIEFILVSDKNQRPDIFQVKAKRIVSEYHAKSIDIQLGGLGNLA